MHVSISYVQAYSLWTECVTLHSRPYFTRNRLCRAGCLASPPCCDGSGAALWLPRPRTGGESGSARVPAAVTAPKPCCAFSAALQIPLAGMFFSYLILTKYGEMREVCLVQSSAADQSKNCIIAYESVVLSLSFDTEINCQWIFTPKESAGLSIRYLFPNP